MISTIPADASTAAGHIPLTGTWFGRVGLRPYALLGLVDQTPGTRVRPLPRLDLAA